MRAIRWTNDLVKVLGLIALFAFGFAGTAELLRSIIVPPIGPKLEAFRQERDEIDLLYLGSSYLANGLDPTVIDAIVTRESGRPIRSFNLAVPGAQGLEVDYQIRALLRTPPARLRWVVIEAPSFEARVPERWRNLSARMAYWHSARQTFIALEQLAVENPPREEAGRLLLFHLRLFGLRVTNLGMGEELFRSVAHLRPPVHRLLLERARERQGFAPFEELEGFHGLGEIREMFEADPWRYALTVNMFRPNEIDPSHTHFPMDVLDAQVRFLESRGITPIYVAPPTLRPAGFFRKLYRENRIPHVLVYADPKRYPGLYQYSNRWDVHHLSERGALLWSQLLARDLVRLIGRQEAAP